MKIYLAIFISVFLVCCKVTKQTQPTATLESPTQEMVVPEKPEQVFIPADALEISTPTSATEEVAPPPPPPPPPPRDEDVPVFKVVEEMPRFPGCEEIEGGNNEKSKCANGKMLEYVYSNLIYPQSAIDEGIEGTVIIQFIVSEHGQILDSNILRDIGNGCGQSALNVVNGMNFMDEKWTSGKQRGRPVDVEFSLPVRFKLDGLDKHYKREK